MAAGGATIFSADVVTLSDIVEALGAVLGHGVEEGVQETEGLTRLLDLSLVDNTDNTGPDGGGGRGTTDGGNTTLVDEDGVTEGSDIRVATTSGVEVRGRGELDVALEVTSDSGGLVRGLRGDVRETTTRGKVSDIVRDSDFITTRRALVTLTVADRGDVLEVELRVVELGGTDGSDKGGGGREVGLEVREGAVRVSTAVGTRVTRSDNDGNTTETDLLEFSVDTGGITVTVDAELLATSSINIALISFRPAVRDGDDLRDRLGAEEVLAETV